MANYNIDSLTYGSDSYTLSTPYGTCTTAAATAAKVVTCANFVALNTGARITVKFTHANSNASPTLNVNSTGAKSIACTGFALNNAWAANSVIDFVYDGSNWQIVGFNVDTNTDTNTHYTSKNIVTNSATGTTNTTTAITTNGNVYLNHLEESTVKSSHKISGSGATTVTTDASGNIVISSTDTNTTYSTLAAENGGTNESLVTTGEKYTWNNKGTVTSVRVQATSPVVSSVNTAQTGSLNTTISLADNYGDTKNPYASKTKNYVLAAPSNAAGTPSFRALVASDIPSLASNKITALTGYSKPTSGPAPSSIGASDSLNTAIGKLEYALDNRIHSNGWETSPNGLHYSCGSSDNGNLQEVYYSRSSITWNDDTTQSGGSLTFPAKSGTIALTSDLPGIASSSTAGIVKVHSTAVPGTTPLNSVTTTSGCFYQVQKNSSGVLVVNVPVKAHTSSTASNVGSASSSVYGHAMASSTTPKVNGTAAVGSETAKFARGDHVHPLQTYSDAYSCYTLCADYICSNDESTTTFTGDVLFEGAVGGLPFNMRLDGSVLYITV